MNQHQEIEVHVVNAFVDAGAGGNPAGVVLHAERFTRAEKQSIATRVGLSETAFVSPSAVAALKLEFFTPNRQIAQCGHATVGSFCFLSETGAIADGPATMETVDGVRAIQLRGGMTLMEQTAPRYTVLDEAMVDEVLLSLGASPDEQYPGLPPVIVDTGNSFLLVPLRSAAAVKAALPRFPMIETISERFNLIGYYIFALEAENPDRHAGARMFAPRYGITEEAATGTAAGCLACFLHHYLGVGEQAPVRIEQGRWMSPPSPSLIQVELNLHHGRVAGLMTGGYARQIETRRIQL